METASTYIIMSPVQVIERNADPEVNLLFYLRKVSILLLVGENRTKFPTLGTVVSLAFTEPFPPHFTGNVLLVCRNLEAACLVNGTGCPNVCKSKDPLGTVVKT